MTNFSQQALEEQGEQSDTLTKKTQLCYDEYYQRKGSERNHPFNAEVTFQYLAYTRCFLEGFKGVPLNSTIIDIGGGSGNALLHLLCYGYNAASMALVDIRPERIAEARARLNTSTATYLCDASHMRHIREGTFDVAFSSTIFLQMLDNELRQAIAEEMIRIVREGGKILIFDWRYDCWRREYLAVDTETIKGMFSVGPKTHLTRRIKGQLIPPLGRFLSKNLSSAYFLVQKLPWVTGLYCYELEKATSSPQPDMGKGA